MGIAAAQGRVTKGRAEPSPRLLLSAHGRPSRASLPGTGLEARMLAFPGMPLARDHGTGAISSSY